MVVVVEFSLFLGTQRHMLGGTLVMDAKAFAHMFRHTRRLAKAFCEGRVFYARALYNATSYSALA